MKHYFYLTKKQIDVVLRSLERSIPHIAEQLQHMPRTLAYQQGRAYLEDQLRDMQDLKMLLLEYSIKR